MQATANDVARSQAGLLNSRADGVAKVADGDQAEIGRPQPDPAFEPELAVAELHRPDRDHGAGDLPPLTLECTANKSLDIFSHPRAEVGSLGSDGYPHGTLRI